MSGERLLEERLRAQLGRWAENAFPDGPADDAANGPSTLPIMPMSEPFDERRRRRSAMRVLVATSVAVVLAVGTFAVVNARRSNAPTTPNKVGPDQALVGVEWQFVSIVVDGKRLLVPSEIDARLRFDGAGKFSAEACNRFSGDVAIESDTIHFGPEFAQTLIGCTGMARRLETAVGRLLETTPTWSVTNGRLHLTSPKVTAELTRPLAVFPTRDLVVIASSERDGGSGQWQFGYQPADKALLYWEGRADPGTAFESAAVRVVPNSTFGMAVSVGTDLIVFGYLPGATATASYIVESKPAIALTLYPLPGRQIVFGQAVGVGGGQVVAYDAAGNELGRTRILTG